MMTNQSFSILVWVKKGRLKNGNAPLILRITVNKQRAELTTNRSVQPSLWNHVAQKVRGNTPEAKSINNHLDSMRASLHSHQSRLVTLGKIVTAQMLKNEYLGKTTDRKTLGDAFKFFIERRKALKEKGKLSDTTLNKYEKTFEYVKQFTKKEYRVEDIQLSDINVSFMEDFAHYLLTKCDLGNNTAMKKIAQAKSVFIMAHGRGWIRTNPAALYKCNYEEDHPVRLEIDELHTIITKQIDLPRLSEARDCYVFMCFTGYAYIDVSGLTRANLFKGPNGGVWVTKNREKTNSAECVPLFPIPLAILQKYNTHPFCQQKGRLLPINSNQKFNAYLKEIADLCGIHKELTTHTARHTFATTVTLENGVPIETVSKMLGHKKLSTTQKYAKVTRKKINENMGQLKRKLFSQNDELLILEIA